jgi:alpha-ketoglutarate-dependent taurine dioxygenase
LQFLHNISHNGTGGMSMIADGFHLAERLRSEHPDTFHYLTTNKIKFWYNDENECLFAEDYVIRLNEQGTVVQFRWNDLDRYPPPPQDLEATSTYYQHTHILNQFIADPRFQYTFKLRPGTTLCVDNWRLMHGRTAFTGLRRMVGAYIQRDTYESRCRHLGVQIDE